MIFGPVLKRIVRSISSSFFVASAAMYPKACHARYRYAAPMYAKFDVDTICMKDGKEVQKECVENGGRLTGAKNVGILFTVGVSRSSPLVDPFLASLATPSRLSPPSA